MCSPFTTTFPTSRVAAWLRQHWYQSSFYLFIYFNKLCEDVEGVEGDLSSLEGICTTPEGPRTEKRILGEVGDPSTPSPLHRSPA